MVIFEFSHKCYQRFCPTLFPETPIFPVLQKCLADSRCLIQLKLPSLTLNSILYYSLSYVDIQKRVSSLLFILTMFSQVRAICIISYVNRSNYIQFSFCCLQSECFLIQQTYPVSLQRFQTWKGKKNHAGIHIEMCI